MRVGLVLTKAYLQELVNGRHDSIRSPNALETLGAEVRDTYGPGLVLLVQLGKRSPLVSHHSTRFRGCTVAALGVDGLIIPIAMPIRPSLIGNLYDQATPTKRSVVRIHTKANQEPAVKPVFFSHWWDDKN